METEHLLSSGLNTYFTVLTKSFPAILTERKTPNRKEETKFLASLPVTGSVMQQSTTQAISCAQFTRLDFLFPVCAHADFLCTSFSDKSQNKKQPPNLSLPLPPQPVLS